MRDAAAEARDRCADDRDENATVRDAAADARDRIPPEHSQIISERTMASWDRKEARDDRAGAAGDRRGASADRWESASERAAAALDELTGAHRRGAGFVELEREMARARRTAQRLVLAFVDVNGLKAINDSRGHTAGDRVLREVVATLRARLRSYDLIIRFGGDEFLCAIPGVTMAEAAERLAAVNTTLATSPEQGSVTTGLAELQPNDSFEDLIARADAALYRQRQQHATLDLTGHTSWAVDPVVSSETGRES